MGKLDYKTEYKGAGQISHPMPPPPELVQQWMTEFYCTPFVPGEACTDLAARAAQWGWDQREPEIQAAADAELEACCEWLQVRINEGWNPCHLEDLRTTRRPKQPSLKEQAYIAVDRIERSGYPTDDLYTIRRALEALPND